MVIILKGMRWVWGKWLAREMRRAIFQSGNLKGRDQRWLIHKGCSPYG